MTARWLFVLFVVHGHQIEQEAKLQEVSPIDGNIDKAAGLSRTLAQKTKRPKAWVKMDKVHELDKVEEEDTESKDHSRRRIPGLQQEWEPIAKYMRKKWEGGWSEGSKGSGTWDEPAMVAQLEHMNEMSEATLDFNAKKLADKSSLLVNWAGAKVQPIAKEIKGMQQEISYLTDERKDAEQNININKQVLKVEAGKVENEFWTNLKKVAKNFARTSEAQHKELKSVTDGAQFNVSKIMSEHFHEGEHIEESTDLQLAELNKIQGRDYRTKNYTKDQLEKLSQYHEMNLNNIDKKSKDLRGIMEHVQKVLAAIPDQREKKVRALDAFNTDDQVAATEEVEDIEKTGQNTAYKLLNTITGMVQTQAGNFESLNEDAEDMKTEGVKNVVEDTTAFEGETRASLESYRKEVTKIDDDLTAKADRNEKSISDTTKTLLDQTKKEKNFPTAAAGSVSKVLGNMANTFNGVRETRMNEVKKSGDDFGQEAKYIGVNYRNQISTTSNDELAKAQGELVAVKKTADQSVLPGLQQTTEMHNLLEKLQDEAETAGQTEIDIGKGVSKLPKELGKADKAVKTRIHEEDTAIESEADSVTAAAAEDIKSDLEKVESAKKNADKSLYKTESVAEGQFDKKLSQSEKLGSSEVGKAEQNVFKLEVLGKNLASKLAGRVQYVGNKVTKTRDELLPEIDTAVKEFMDEARTQVNNAPLDIANAMHIARDAVKGHMAGLEQMSNLALQSIPDLTNPAYNKLNGKTNAELDGVKARLNEIEAQYKETQIKVADWLDSANDRTKKLGKAMETAQPKTQELFNEAQAEITADHAKLAQVSIKQQAQLNTANVELDQLTKDGITKINQELETQHDAAEANAGATLRGSKREIEGLEDDLGNAIKKQTGQVAIEETALQKSSSKVQGMLAEVNAALADAKSSTGQTNAALIQSMEGEAKNARSDDRDLNTALREGAAAVEAEGKATFEKESQSADYDFSQQDRAGAQEERASQRDVKKSTSALGDAMNAIRQKAQEEMDSASSETDKLRAQVKAERRSVQDADKDLEKQYKALERSADLKNQAFANGVENAKLILTSMAGKDSTEMQKVLGMLDDLSIDVKTKEDQQIAKDTLDLGKVLTGAKVSATKTGLALSKSASQIEDFETKFQEADEKSQAVVDKNTKQMDLASEKFREQSRIITAKLDKETQNRQASVTKMKQNAALDGERLSDVMGTLGQMASKVGGSVSYELGQADLEAKSLDRQLKKAVEFTKHSDEGALQRVITKAQAAEAEESKQLKWKEETDVQQDAFRLKVQNAFSQLGVELDLTALEGAEQRGREQWATQQQMAGLRDALGEEVGELSSLSKQRLAALAAGSAKEIAALMAQEGLTEEERATKLAAIKEKARVAAQQILQENGQLKLEQKTASRNLKIALDRIEKSTDAMADIDDASFRHGNDVNGVIGRVQDVIRNANRQIQHDSAVQDFHDGARDTATANTATADSATASLLDESDGVASAIESAKAAVSDNLRWNDDLHDLDSKMHNA